MFNATIGTKHIKISYMFNLLIMNNIHIKRDSENAVVNTDVIHAIVNIKVFIL
jgi:hypothetical protein